MSTPADLHAAVVARLQGIGSLTVFEGDVPDKPPADTAGRVYGYAVVWGNPGFVPPEAKSLAGPSTGTELDWQVQVTVAAGTLPWCLASIAAVRAALVGQLLTFGAELITEIPGPGVQIDRTTTPPRHYAALLFHTLTP